MCGREGGRGAELKVDGGDGSDEASILFLDVFSMLSKRGLKGRGMGSKDGRQS